MLSELDHSLDMRRLRGFHQDRINRIHEGPHQNFDEIEKSMYNANLQTIQIAHWNQATWNLIALLHAESQKESFTICLAQDGCMERQKKLLTAIHSSNPNYELSLGIELLENRLPDLEKQSDSLTPDQFESECNDVAYGTYFWYITCGASKPENFEANTKAAEQVITRIRALRQKKRVEQVALGSEIKTEG